MKLSFLGIPKGGGKGYELTFPSPCTCITSAAKGVVFMDKIRKPFLFGNFYILLIKKKISLNLFFITPLPSWGLAQPLASACENYRVPKTTPSPNIPCGHHGNAHDVSLNSLPAQPHLPIGIFQNRQSEVKLSHIP